MDTSFVLRIDYSYCATLLIQISCHPMMHHISSFFCVERVLCIINLVFKSSNYKLFSNICEILKLLLFLNNLIIKLLCSCVVVELDRNFYEG
jgi:hypothetical protein